MAALMSTVRKRYSVKFTRGRKQHHSTTTRLLDELYKRRADTQGAHRETYDAVIAFLNTDAWLWIGENAISDAERYAAKFLTPDELEAEHKEMTCAL